MEMINFSLQTFPSRPVDKFFWKTVTINAGVSAFFQREEETFFIPGA